MNLVGVAAQHLGFGPGARVPEADGLIARRGDQPSSVPAKRQLANPTGVSVEPDEEPAGCGIPDADGGIFKSRARSQHPPVGRDGQRGQPAVPLRFGLPEFLAGGEVDALDAVAVVRSVRTCQIQTPVVGGQLGGPKKPVPVAVSVGWRLSILAEDTFTTQTASPKSCG